MRQYIPTLVTGALLLAGTVPSDVARAQDNVLVDFADFSPREVRTAGFALSTTQDVRIDAVGADHRYRSRRGDRHGFVSFDRSYWIGNAWIVDARTRNVVWELAEADTDRDRREGTRSFTGTVRLPAGEYEVHYASFSYTRVEGGRRGRFDRSRLRYLDDGVSEAFMLTVAGAGRSLGTGDIDRLRDAFVAGAIVSFTDFDVSDRARIGLAVTRTTEIEIYAIGEIIDESSYDYGRLKNLETGEVVWDMTDWSTDYAGGAEKNRMVREVVTLEPGRYGLTYVTDDSHQEDDWNAAPPYDPGLYGITVRPVQGAAGVTTFEYDPAAVDHAFVSMTALGDGDAVSQGFTIDRRTDVRVIALGEGTRDRMYDYGWIVDAQSRRRVWEMDYYDSDHAGGGDKNRIQEEVIALEPGNYVAYFVTDGSHSYDEWNTGPPLDEELWGLTLAATSAGGRAAISGYDPRADPNIIAQIVMMRDDERERVEFTLERETRVRIYALGEGISGDMYDYGTIRNRDTRRIVWRMTYRDTQHAGGARKNRLASEILTLPAGRYSLTYETDGSHAFGDWNADAPDDPEAWGVTLYRSN